jgi:23S rRNA (pseudouridine1915-N3)-methyltransferase
MKLELVVVGKTSPGWIREGFEDYLGRLRHYLPCSVREIPAAGALPAAKALEKESRQILEKITSRDWVILLDERGKSLTSVELSALLAKRMNDVSGNLVMVTGGAFGVSDEVRERAELVLSCSGFTFTHQMIRLILAEQLYRAMTILRNESYHHV